MHGIKVKKYFTSDIFHILVVCISLHINIFQINSQARSDYSYNYYAHSYSLGDL